MSAGVHEWKDHVANPYEFNGRQFLSGVTALTRQ